MTLRELSKIVGANCENPDTGEGCSGGDYDVELHPSCGGDGLFAEVIADGALLIDKAPPDDSVRRAALSRSQLVCIQAIARAGVSASYYYVVAIPGKASRAYRPRKIEWYVPRTGHPCLGVSRGRFEGDCAAGWTRESNLVVINGN